MEEAQGTSQYRTATPNFFALTHYNRSYFYATSVAELADAIDESLQSPKQTAERLKTRRLQQRSGGFEHVSSR